MAINIETNGKKCENCNWWKRQGATLIGKCGLVVESIPDDARYRIMHDKVRAFPFQSSAVYTGQDFFCLLHNCELKKDDK